jgi:hypothetical protein
MDSKKPKQNQNKNKNKENNDIFFSIAIVYI